jgi:hypothetical protein
MILQRDYYKRNEKTGDIIKRQRVWVKCDGCGAERETLYEYVKYKKYAGDLCISCRNRESNRNSKRRQKKEVSCDQCGKNFKRSLSLIKPANFCSRLCYDAWYVSRYDRLWESFDLYPNETAYLFGLVLGDGNLKKSDQKTTTRIRIAFDCKLVWTLEIAKGVFEKLGISYHVEPKSQANCQHVGFVLPDKLLAKYRMDFVGDKYKAQPSLAEGVAGNINFIAGMINSDGCCYLARKKYETIRVSNTVPSIVASCRYCLDLHDIGYVFNHYPSRIDKRNGNLNREYYLLSINRKDQIRDLRHKSSFMIKEPSNGQHSGK